VFLGAIGMRHHLAMGAVTADHAPVECGPLLQIEKRQIMVSLGMYAGSP
jgi:hypothetical protein